MTKDRKPTTALPHTLHGLDKDPVALDAATRAAPRFHVPMTLLHEGKIIETEATRLELLARSKAGEEFAVTLRYIAFEQTVGKSNRNFVRFRDEQLDALAASFVGVPFLRDHDLINTDARQGTVRVSELERKGDTARILQEAEIVRPDGVQDTLRGFFDRFSIGWNNLSPPECSLCGEPASHCKWEKRHFRGSEHGGQVVEWVLEGEGVECSAVNVPAVPGARAIGVRHDGQELSANETVPENRREEQRQVELSELCQEMRLPADSSVAQVLAAVQASNRELASERQRADLADAQIEALTAEVKEVKGKLTRQTVDAIVNEATDAGKLTLGGVAEEQLRELAARDSEKARKWVAEMPMVTPVGQPSQSGAEPTRDQYGKLTGDDGPSANPTRPVLAGGEPDFEAIGEQLEEHELQVAQAKGLTRAAFAEHMWRSPRFRARFEEAVQ